MARFEVLGLDSDRDLIRSLADRLARNDANAARPCASVKQTVGLESERKGRIFGALRRSPIVNTGINLARSREAGRKLDL